MRIFKFLSKKLLVCALNLMIFPVITNGAESKTKPNVIIVITDDQGYGDLACHGNPVIQTPHLDNFYDESVRFTDFHVFPTCAPTRASLMTGKYANSTGVWHTIGGCSILRKEEKTLAQIFQQNGYKTGMFGKWHLGDTYPSRPQDKGFDHVVSHGGGGVGQTPDYWGNDYFNDTYMVNGEPKKFEGYCSDVWFEQSMKFITKNKEKPFFCYLSLNAPHSPYNVPEKYYNQYKNEQIPEDQKRFYGMITNIDDNFNKLKNLLAHLDIEENTILIFMTDNGTAAGYKEIDGDIYGYNAGMRGVKASKYEGGHRVPFFISYPGQKIGGGKDISELTSCIDIVPTLASLCRLENLNLDVHGVDLSPLLQNKQKKLKRKYVISDSQRVQEPEKWRKSSVMSENWRLIDGKELYNILSDPGQRNDLAKGNTAQVNLMRLFYEEWWAEISKQFNLYPTIIVGSSKQNPVEITCHDSHSKDKNVRGISILSAREKKILKVIM